MELLIKLKDYLQANKEWLFSGMGVVLTTSLIALLVGSKKIFKSQKQEIETQEVLANHLLKSEKINIYTPRGEFDDDLTFVVNQAKRHVTLLSITFGFTSYPKLEKLIEERSISFDFYVLNPKSKYFKERNEDIKSNSIENDYLINSDITNLLKLKKQFPDRVNIFEYDSYPFWHYVLIDNKKVFLSYHPLNKQGYKKCNIFEIEESISVELFNLFKSHIELINMKSIKI